ncbi:MAG TPA: serine/threonine-protein kinase [Pseudonocardiaceae bacterium]
MTEGDLIAGRYRLVCQVGSGAMGVVWQARDELLHRVVAVKEVLLPLGMSEPQAEEATRRAMREGRIAARLHHPHAITVYDVVEHEDKPCLIMEYLHSESLSAVLARRGPLPPADVARIGSQIAAALAAAHLAGIVHRDIKPGNVLIADDGTAKITDFGISRAIGDGTVTATGVLAGTPAYFAPEVAQGQNAGFHSDVFSLGSTLYAAVEGAPPFGLDDNPIALIYRITTSEIIPPKQAGPLTPVLVESLRRNRSQRPTMTQVQQALDAVADPPSDSTADPSSTGPSSTGPSRPAPAVAATPAMTGIPALQERTIGSLPLVNDATRDAATRDAAGQAPAPEPRPGRSRSTPRRSAIAVAVMALVAMGILTGTVINNAGGTSGGVAGPTTPASGTSRSQQPPSPTADTHPPAASPAPGPPISAAPPQDTPGQLRAAISDYYALMPGHLQDGWGRLTTGYQDDHAGGFASYQSFWNSMQRVEVSDVSATEPAAANATITYFYKDGRVIEERTSFGLANEDGRWKIGSSTVTSSHTKNI